MCLLSSAPYIGPLSGGPLCSRGWLIIGVCSLKEILGIGSVWVLNFRSVLIKQLGKGRQEKRSVNAPFPKLF